MFRQKARSPGAQGRAASPDLIIGSWCGKKFVPSRVASRAGLSDVAAVRHNAVHEIKSSLILQPGPAALTDGRGSEEDGLGRHSGDKKIAAAGSAETTYSALVRAAAKTSSAQRSYTC